MVAVPQASLPNATEATSPRTRRRRDDTARFIERFEAVTGYRLRSTNAEGLPRQLLAHPVPPPDTLVEHYGFELEPRTQNALCRFEPGRQSEPWTIGRLLKIRGFGVFSLVDLLEVLAKHGIFYRI